MPEFLITSPEGKQYRVTGPDGSTKDQALSHLQQQLSAQPKTALPAEPGYATERGGSPAPNAVALKETITGTSDKPQPELLASQQEIEKRLRASGMKDAEIERNPEWQAASRNLSRSVSAAGSQTAIGSALGMLAPEAAPLVSKGASRIAATLPTAKNAALKESTEALRGEAVGQAEKQITSRTGEAQAPLPSTMSAQSAAQNTGTKVMSARQALSQADAKVAAAAEKAKQIGQRLSAADKYAQKDQRSASNVRALRQQYQDATKELEQAKGAREQAFTVRQNVEQEAKDARQELSSAKTSAKSAAARAQSAQKIADKYSTLRNQFQEEKDPAALSRLSDRLFNDLRSNGLLSDAQHKAYLRQVDDVQKNIKSAQAAKERLKKIAGSALLIAGGFEARRLYKDIIP